MNTLACQDPTCGYITDVGWELLLHYKTMHPDFTPPASDPPPVQDRVEQRAAELEALLVDSTSLEAIPNPVPVIDGIIQLDSIASAVGQPGHGKSFVALDMAGHIGSGRPWHGRTVRQGKVLYLVAEGVSGVKKRVRAWEKIHGSPMKNVMFLPMAVQSTNATEWAAFIEVARRVDPVLIIIDTQARVTVGIDENGSKDVGVYVQRLEDLRAATGACVMSVHHQGRNGDHGRGSNALDGAATTIMTVSKSNGDKPMVTVKSYKQKDLEDFPKIEFTLTTVELGLDEELRPITSAVLERINHSPNVEEEDFADNQAKLVGVMRDHFGPEGTTSAQLRSLAKSQRGISDSSFYKAFKALIEKKVFQQVGTSQRYRFVSLEDRSS